MRTTRPPVDYLVTASKTSLESFQCARLNLAASLRKEVRQILDEWISVEVDARLAAWVLDRRRAQEAGRDQRETLPTAPVHLAQLAMSFLPPFPAEPQNDEFGTGDEPDEPPRVEAPSESLVHKVALPSFSTSLNVTSAELPHHARRSGSKSSHGQCALRVLERLDKQASLEFGDGVAPVPPGASQIGRSERDAIARPEMQGHLHGGSKGEKRPTSPLRAHYAHNLAKQCRLAAAS